MHKYRCIESRAREPRISSVQSAVITKNEKRTKSDCARTPNDALKLETRLSWGAAAPVDLEKIFTVGTNRLKAVFLLKKGNS